MPDNRLTFTLAGRDELSRVLNGTADSADRLRLRLAGVTGDSDGQLRDLQGRFLSADEAARRLGDSSNHTRSSMAAFSDSAKKLGESLKASLISLAPAAIPAAAALAGAAAQVATQLGAAGLAAGAYALALKPQISAISDVISAQSTYDNAVKKSGATSQAAATAQVALQKQLAVLPPATQKAAVAVGILRDNFQGWSNSLSGDVMAPFTKGVAVANDLLPKTSGLVKGASTQFDRLITLVGGEISTPGFDGLANRVTDFSEKTMRDAVDKLTIFLAKANTGQIGHGINQFLDYAHAQGPAVWETLEHVGEALINVLKAGSDVGVGMLDVVNGLSGIVAAVPPQAIAGILQLAIAVKAVRLAGAGLDAAKVGLAAIGVQLTGMTAAAGRAPGALGGVTAAIGTMSKGAKLAMAGTGIGLLLIGLSAISSKSKSAPPDVDKLTTSLKTLGDTGKVTGEAARAFGKDLSGLGDSLQKVASPKGLDRVQQDIISFFGTDSTPVKEAKDNIDAFDKSLASLVSSGNAKLAAAALKDTIAKLQANGQDTSKLRGQLNDYNDALAGQALEQKLAAQSMGLFGDQAQQTQSKLDAQKQSADGLRQSIQALNDVNRSALDGQIGLEAAIDAAADAAKKNAGVLDYQNGKLTVGTAKQRDAAQALSDLAAKTDDAAASARDNGASWSTVNGIYEEGRTHLIASAKQMGLTTSQAKKLADQILHTPDKTAMLKADASDLNTKLKAAQAKVDSLKQKRATAVGADKSKLDSQIKAAQAKVDSLKQKHAAAVKASNQAGAGASAAQHTIDAVHGKTVTITTVYKTNGGAQHAAGNPYFAKGGLLHRAHGGPIPHFDDGGHINGPGTPTSDSILMWGSTGEYMVRAAAVAKYGTAFLDALNAGSLPTGRGAPRPGLAAATSATRTAVEDRPLIGTLTVQTGPNATADEIVSSALFEARVARRRGVHT